MLAIVRGEAMPASPEQGAIAAACATRRKMPARAAQLFVEAFAAAPELAVALRIGYRYEAARAAALTGTGASEVAITEEACAQWRRRALRWLRDDLEAWDRHHAADADGRRARVEHVLQHWQQEADLAGLRDPARVERLPAAEQAECRALWRDVAALLERARPERAPESRR